jgi:hypothetical protein
MSGFHWRYFLETLCLALYVVNKDFFSCIFTSAGGNILKLLAQHIACLCYKWCQFGYVQSVIKDISVVKNIPFCLNLGFHWRVFFLNLHTSHLTCMGFTRCECGFDRSLVKDTLLSEQSTSSTSYRLLLQGFS